MLNCPVCNDSRMREVEKNGILIDVCPSCKGVWLDRGELDKLMNDVREVRAHYNEWHYRDKIDDDDDDRRRKAKSIGRLSPARFRITSKAVIAITGNPNYGNGNPNYGQGHDKHDDNGSDGRISKKKKKKSVLDVFGDLFD